MQWYYWVLIAVGVVMFGVLKVKLAGNYLKAMKQRQEARERGLEEDV